MGFEEAIVSTGFNQILYDILTKFLSELRPSSEEPTTPDTINAVLRSVVAQCCAKTPQERTVWWMESSKTNAHPFSSEDVDFFAMSWQDKLVVLRQLVDWQLAYSNVKEIIDIAWEVKYQRKKKKTNKTLAAEFAPPDEDDPMSINNLRMVAIGQDSSRIRYWVVDDSPRVWASPNPWRMNCPMTVVATTIDEYAALVKKIRDTAPEVAEGTKVKLSKPQQAHVELLPALEVRYDAVDSYAKRIKALKRQRQEEKEEDERASVIAMVEEERKALEMGSRTRSRATAGKSEEPDEMDVSEDDLKPGPSTTKRKAKGRSSAPKKAPGKKRKREESPSPSDPNGGADTPQVVEEPASEEVPVKPAAKGKGAAASGRRKSGRDVEAKKSEEVEDDMSQEQEEVAATPKARPAAKFKTEPNASLVEEESAPPAEAESMLEDQPRQALGKRRSTRNSTARAPSNQSPEEDDGAVAVSSMSSRSKKVAPSRAVGSRRSGRFAKVDTAEMDQDAQPQADNSQGEGVSGLAQAPDDIPSDEKETMNAPPRKKTRTTRQSQTRAEDKTESASTSTVADEDKMDVDASSTDATASEAGAREKLPPSESGDTTPVNPSHTLSALGPQSPVMKAGWGSDLQSTSQTSPAKTVPPVSAT